MNSFRPYKIKSIFLSVFLLSSVCFGETMQERKTDCDGGKGSACRSLGRSYKNQGNIDAARNAFIKACELGYCRSLGRFYENQGNIEAARTTFQKGCKNYRYDCLFFGRFEVRHGNIKKARKIYTKHCDEGYSGGCHDRGELEHNRKDYRTAARYFKKSCDMATRSISNSESCYMYGYALLNQGKRDLASKAFREMCNKKNRNSFHSLACFKLGSIEQDKGNTGKAFQFFYYACQSQPGSPSVSLPELRTESAQ